MSEPNNGTKVTLAVVQNEIIHLREDIQGLRQEVQSWRIGQEIKITELENWKATSRERWDAHKEEHSRENFMLKAWASVSAALGGAIGGIASWLASR